MANIQTSVLDAVKPPSYHSLRVAAFSFALSSWVEGYSMLRYSVSAASAPETQLLAILNAVDSDEGEGEASSGYWFSQWLHRKGRRMDDVERRALGIIDITTAVGALRSLQSKPVLPFLLTPLLTTIPLPRPSDMRNCRWTRVLLLCFLLCLLRELERVIVACCVAYYRKYRDAKDGVYSGPVIVRGIRLPRPPPSSSSIYDDAEDQLDCMICSGQNDMSQSVTSLSSVMSDSEAQGPPPSTTVSMTAGENLGPLEAFCTVAPTKHVAHRECFLRWHSAYQAQSRPRIPDIVMLTSRALSTARDARGGSNIPDEMDMRRARALLRSVGFLYLIGMLRPNTGSSTFSPPRSLSPLSPLLASERGDATSPFIPTFTLHPHQSTKGPSTSLDPAWSGQPSSSRARLNSRQNSSSTQDHIPPRCLATLRTECPPCPGCRSAVEMHFCAVSHMRDDNPSQRHKGWITPGSPLSRFICHCRTAMRHFAHEASALITGRTIGASLSTQLSFLLTIWSMTRARDKTIKPREVR
ncbi:uncharacterized protein EI90DRAFT_3041021 [Cantharellus anzutake]|uniref:uncharacterized protein n=1 Tax=Cantharellus anzutake TaxID=1750568 RepID=UPI00190751A7|nr:uncharacterized protein EI90DRAFT_3041021 [Cantharellus anzutake]KAF8337913.1 hypothetical protein EI90DRAFT_3041021 [Cantharellus anzutake]